MGGLKKYMPITYWTSVIGSLALIGFPGTSGFFSKDALIDAVHVSHLPGATYAYICVVAGVFITAFYSFRLVFMTFHGKERFDTAEHHHQDPAEATTIPDANKKAAIMQAVHDQSHPAHDHHANDSNDGHDHHSGPPHESPWVVTLPLILLAIPSLFIGWFTVEPILFGNYFGSAIQVDEAHNVLGELAHEFHGSAAFVVEALKPGPVWLALLGVLTAWWLYIMRTDLPAKIANTFAPLYKLLTNKFYFDEIYFAVFARGSRELGTSLWKVGDAGLIDGVIVNGSARAIGWFASVVRGIQTGRLYGYAFAMFIGLAVMLGWFVVWPLFK
jgi:NADH-quinone oxidoreductase subunit L